MKLIWYTILIIVTLSFSETAWTQAANPRSTILIKIDFPKPHLSWVEEPLLKREDIDFLPEAVKREVLQQGRYVKVEMVDTYSGSVPGEPVLPVKGVTALIPYGKAVSSIDISLGQRLKIPGRYIVAPGQRPVPLLSEGEEQVAAEYDKPAAQVYSSAEAYPADRFSNVMNQWKRGYSLLVLCVHPVEYIPVDGEIYYYQSAVVEVKLADVANLEMEYSLYRAKSADRQAIEKMVVNPEVLDTYPSQAPRRPGRSPLSAISAPTSNYDYVIITNNELLNSSAAYRFQELANHKQSRGLDTTIVTTEWIYANYSGARPDGGSDNQTRVRNFIIDAYLNWGTEYVLLGGDADGADVGGESGDNIVHCRLFYISSPETGYLPADMYYSCLDGSFDYDADGKYAEPHDGPGGGEVDLYAEVFVGRAAVDSEAELSNFVYKIISYENSIFTDPFRKTAEMLGEDLGWAWGKDYKEEIRLGSSNWGYTTVGFPADWTVATLYDADGYWSEQQLITHMNNDQFHIYNHLGHSNNTYVMKLSNSDVDALTNSKWFFAYSQGCYAGAFDNKNPYGSQISSDCIAEHFTLTPHGAFAFIGNSRYGWGESGSTNGSSQYYDRQFFDAYFGEGIKHLGKINADSKEDTVPFLSYDANRWCYYNINLFGCPQTPLGGEVTSKGIVSFSANSYKDGALVEIALMDWDLNTPGNIDVYTDKISLSTTSGDLETTFTMTETGTNSGTFSGQMLLVDGNYTANNGIIEVLHDDVITASYFDADDGSGNPAVSTDTARADFVVPQISNVKVTYVYAGGATIEWDTDELSNSEVHYGLSPATLSYSQKNDLLVGAHRLNLWGLQAATTYYFEVCSGDEAGNLGMDNNGGLCYQFTTPEAKKILSYIEYADTSPGDEYENTLAAISSKSVHFVNTELTDYTELATNLVGKDILLIPEQEYGNQSLLRAIGFAWSSMLMDFVNQGGVIICCDYYGPTWALLDGAGLMSISGSTYISGSMVNVIAPDDPVAQGVAPAYTAEYYSCSFTTSEDKVIVECSGNPVVINKQIGLGHVVLIGHDYYSSNAEQDKIVGNAVFNLPEITSRGQLILNKQYYCCADSTDITVKDLDLAGLETYNVYIDSTTETTSETVTLTESSYPGVFEGSISTDTGPAVPDGNLQVSHGDTITAYYYDEDAGAGLPALVTEQAEADCLPPVISNVGTTNVYASAATIIWDTDEPSDSEVHYGLSSANLDYSQADTSLVYTHNVYLTGLEPDTTYYFEVCSTDAAGNTSTDNNSGLCYQFTTPEAKKILSYIEYADTSPGDEYENTLAAISSKGINFVNTELTDFTELSTNLVDKDVLLIPEQEYGNHDLLQAIGFAWSSMLLDFVTQGGVIVCCDYGGPTWALLDGAGLMSISDSTSISGYMVNVIAPDDPVAQGVASTYTAEYYSCSFTTSEGKVIVKCGINPVVINKQIGLGHVVLIGHDYYSSNAEQDKIVGNAVFNLPEVTSRGQLILNKQYYHCADSIDITVKDLDLAGLGSCNIYIDSTSETSSETVTLSETSVPGKFQGSISTDTGPPIPDGNLQVSHGDTITGYYYDEDDGTGLAVSVTQQAEADCQPPIFAGLESATAGSGYVDLAWSAATDPHGPIRYNIYRDQTAGGSIGWLIASTEELSYRDCTVAPTRTYYYVVRAEDTAGNEDNNTVERSATLPDCIIIGTGTDSWNYPMRTYYHDARTQVIYQASELRTPCQIMSLALDVTTIPGQTMNNWTIRMKHTSMSSYPSSPEWENTGWTTVYQSNQTVSSTGWVTFTFSTPFEYNGVDDLLIDFSYNNSSYTSNGYCRYSTPGGTRSLYRASDSGYGDPLDWSGRTPTPYSSTNVPNIMLCVETDDLSLIPFEGFNSAGPEGGPFSPAAKTYTLINTGSASLNWAASKTAAWLDLSNTGGTLIPGASDTVEVSINADSLPTGIYYDTITFTNTSSGLDLNLGVTLLVGHKNLLAYIQYADTYYGGEYQNTLAAISSVGTNFTVDELMDYTQLGAMLPGHDVLLIPEQENANSSQLESIGAAWASTLEDFLNNGGVVIQCDYYGRYGILTAAGLMSISSSDNFYDQSVTIVAPGDPVAQGVSSPYTACSGSSYYNTSEGQVVVEWTGYGPVVINKVLGLGNVVLIGHDYTASNAAQDRIVGNAVFSLPSIRDDLIVIPWQGFASAGPEGGPFSPGSKTYTLTNNGSSPLNWTAGKTAAWLDLSDTAGTLAQATSTTIEVSVNVNANSLPAGTYNDTITFTNTTSGVDQTRAVEVTVRGIDHFEWDTITSPQLANVPFPVTIRAKDLAGYTVTTFTGKAALSGTSGQIIDFFSDDFEDGDFDGWTVLSGSYIREVTDATAANGTQYSYMQTGGANDHDDGIEHSVSGQPTHISFYIRSGSTTAADAYFVVWGDGGRAIFFYAKHTGYLCVYPGDESFAYTANTWYHIEFQLDWVNQTFDYYVNSALIASDLPFRDGAMTSLTEVHLYNYHYSTAWYDEIEFIDDSVRVPISISPTVTGNFVGGVWTGDVTVHEVGRQVVLTADDGSGHIGLSNEFDVLDYLVVTPWEGFESSGPEGGPFSPVSKTYTLTNIGSASLNWTASKTAAWLDLSNTGGTLAPGASDTVEVSINVNANSLPPGIYSDSITFTNTTSWVDQTREVTLGVIKRILAYIQYADTSYGDEYENTLAAISSVGTNYTVDELTDYTQLDMMLPGHDVLLIPDQEYASSSQLESIGAAWATTLQDFLSNGGVVIQCDYYGKYGILTGAALMTITSSGNFYSQSVNVVAPGDPVAQGVSSPYTACNGSSYYNTTEGIVVVERTGYGPVVINKELGLGNVVLIGHDYYGSNADQDRIVGNAVFNLPSIRDDLVVTPWEGFESSGPEGGPFSPISKTYTLTNSGSSSLNWTASKTVAWLDLSKTGGTLAPGASDTVGVSINANANSLPAGSYTDTVTFTNTSSGVSRTRNVLLSVLHVATVPFFEDFESGTLALYWQSTGTNEYRTQVTTAYGPYGGSYHLTMDDSVSGGNMSRNELTLVIDLADYENIELSFWVKEFNDEDHGPPSIPFIGGADFDGVAISEDGNTWYEVQGLRSANGISSSYSQFTVDLDAAIAICGLSYNRSFRIRFNHYDGHPIDTDGFAFDDISVIGQLIDDLQVSPIEGFASAGPEGGPFSPAAKTYTLTNTGSASLNWTANKTMAWLDLSKTGGTLSPSASDTVEISINANANSLPAGTYTDTVAFTNTSSGVSQTRRVTLSIPYVATVPFFEDFESGTLAPYWQSTGTNNYRTQVTTAYSPYGGSYHLTMDSSGGPSRNELTLVINLAEYDNMELSFRMKEFGDEDHGPPPTPFIGGADFDGVAISEDGNTWYEVQGLRSADGISSSYSQFTVDLDAAIATYGLSYNRTFTIRFNHFDDSSIGSDGFAFDNISVSGVAPAPTPTPTSTPTPSPPKVISPNGGEQWEVGSTQKIRWEPGDAGDQVDIELSRDNGATWQEIATEIANTGINLWRVTSPASENCLIRISSVSDATISDTSDAKFSIFRSGLVELLQVDIEDSCLLSIAGEYDFLFSSTTPTLQLTGSFAQDAAGALTFSGIIRENDVVSSFTTHGKIRMNKANGQVCGKLKKVKLPELQARASLEFTVSGDELNLTIRYKKGRRARSGNLTKIVDISIQPLACPEHGARIVLGKMSKVKKNHYIGAGTLILPHGISVPVRVTERVKPKKEDSLIRTYRFKGAVNYKRVCSLRLKAWMPTPGAEYMKLHHVSHRRISYVKTVNLGSIWLVY